VESIGAALTVFERALATLEQLTVSSLDGELVRDAAIQRFEYSYDTGWKDGREFLLRLHGLDCKSPNSVIRTCAENHVIDPMHAERLLEIGKDRNKTVHTYDEAKAAEIAAKLPAHARDFRIWLEAMRRASGE